MPPQFEILFYSKVDGTEPAKEFILSLDKKMKAKSYKVDFFKREENTE